MTTRADLEAAIADDIDDTEGEYASQIVKAIQAAQRFCERDNYYFNETRDETFATVANQEWYGSDDNANIPSLVRIHALYIDGAELARSTPEDLETIAVDASGKPTNWTYFEQKIRLSPTPDAAYTVRMQLGPYRLGELAESSSTNAWLTEAYDLLKARAKYILQKDTLKDAAMAMEALNDFKDQRSALFGETAQRTGTGFVVPSQF
jgi:hypothetical protein